MHEWLTDGNAEEQLMRLLGDFHIGKQTAWSLRRHAENFHIGLLGDFPAPLANAMGIHLLKNGKAAWEFVREAGPRIAIAPLGGELRYQCEPAT